MTTGAPHASFPREIGTVASSAPTTSPRAPQSSAILRRDPPGTPNRTGPGGGGTATLAGVSRRQLLALAFGALAVRTVYNAAFLRHYVPISDAHHYHTLASNIAAGNGLAAPFPFEDVVPQATAFRPPLYPMVLGGAYAIFGDHLFVAQVVNILLGTGVVVLVALVAARIAGPAAGLAAGMIAAVYPPLLANDGPPLSEPLSLVLLLGAILLLLRPAPIAAGVATGALVLTRPSAPIVAAGLGIWVLRRFGWRTALAYALPVLVLVTPWIARNWIQLGSPVYVTSDGFNLAALYSPEALDAGEYIDSVFDPRMAAVRAESFALEDEILLDETLRRRALSSLREHPDAPFRRLVGSAWNLFEPRPPSGDGPELLDGRNFSVRYAGMPMMWLVSLFGLVGLWSVRREPDAVPVLLVGVLLTAIILPTTLVPPRLRAPLDVCCCIGAGIAAVGLARRSGRAAAPDPPPPRAVVTGG